MLDDDFPGDDNNDSWAASTTLPGGLRLCFPSSGNWARPCRATANSVPGYAWAGGGGKHGWPAWVSAPVVSSRLLNSFDEGEWMAEAV